MESKDSRVFSDITKEETEEGVPLCEATNIDYIRSPKHSEAVLLKFLLKGICKGISNEKGIQYKIDIVDIHPGVFENIECWNATGYIQKEQPMLAENLGSSSEFTEASIAKVEGDTKISRTLYSYVYGDEKNPRLLIRIPKVSDTGYYNMLQENYYIVNRQRLAANIPICLVDTEDIKGRSYYCNMRSVNMETCESRDILIKRCKYDKVPNVLCIVKKYSVSTGPKDVETAFQENKPKSSNNLPVVRYILLSAQKSNAGSQQLVDRIPQTLLALAEVLGASKTVLVRLRVEINSQSSFSVDLPPESYQLPSCVDGTGAHRKLDIINNVFYAETVTLLLMVIKFLNVEMGEAEVDDQDDYSNKIAELPAILIGLTIRKDIRSRLKNTKKSSDFSNLHHSIFISIRDSLSKNSWSVVDVHDTELQLSRNAGGMPLYGKSHAFSEVVTYRTSVSSTTDQSQKYELRQLNATQRGILCQMITPDDENAGLRQYLAADAYVSCALPTEENYQKVVAILTTRESQMIEDEEEEPDDLLLFSDDEEWYEEAKQKSVPVSKLLLDNWQEMGKDLLAAETLSKVMPLVHAEEADRNVLWIHNYVPVLVYSLRELKTVMCIAKAEFSEFSWNVSGNIIESRYHYGRFMVKVEGYCYDSRELVRRRPDLQLKALPFSELLYERPFLRHEPVPRALLGARLQAKVISVPSSDLKESTYFTLLDPCQDKYYPKIMIGGKLENVPQEEVKDTVSSIKNYWFGRQSSLTTTNVAKRLGKNSPKGTHVITAFTTYRGLGIEDGLVVNAESVRRGMFAVHHNLFLVWTVDMLDKNIVHKIEDVKICAPYDRPCLQGDVLATIEYITSQGEAKHSYFKHDGNYIMYVDEIRLVYDAAQGNNSAVGASALLRIEVRAHRKKFLQDGDKIADPHGQKAVVVKVAEPEELPNLTPLNDNPELDSLLKKRNYKPDLIMNMLAVLARGTISLMKDASTNMFVVLNGYDQAIEDVHTGQVTLVKQGKEEIVNPDSIPLYYCKSTLASGLVVDKPIAIGCTYNMLPPHIADLKPRGLGTAGMDVVTGLPDKPSKDTPVRLGWQEFYSIMHSNSIRLREDVYNNENRLYRYPYCIKCAKSVEVYKEKCVHCGEIVDDVVMLPKSIRMVQIVFGAMGCTMSFSK